MTDLSQPFAAAEPLGGLHGCLQISSGVVARFEWLSAESIQQIHQQQLLMLLFVMESQFGHGMQLLAGTLEQLFQPDIDPSAPGHHLLNRGSGEQPPFRPGMPFTDSFVIGVELVTPAGITGGVSRQMRLQQKGLEEPGGVGQMPFRRAGVLHALQHQILRFQG